MTPESDLLLIGAGTKHPRNPWTQQILEKLRYSLSKIISHKQVLVHRVLESTNDLRSVFVGNIHFKKLMKFRKFIEIFHCCITSFRNTNVDGFIQYQVLRTILREKNMGQSLIKKHSKFLNVDKIFYCGMTRIWNSILNYCGFCRFVKVIKPRKVFSQSLFKNHLKFQNFNIQ